MDGPMPNAPVYAPFLRSQGNDWDAVSDQFTYHRPGETSHHGVALYWGSFMFLLFVAALVPQCSAV